MIMTNLPLAANGLNSYRYKSNYGWVMIGAMNLVDALQEASRSLSNGKITLDRLQEWNGTQYQRIIQQ